MTTLYYNGQVRTESDATIISTILRKGGKDIGPPPAFNPATQAAPTYNGIAWVTRALTQAELDALAEQAAADLQRQQAKAAITKLQNPGADTATQRIARIEAILVRIIKDTIR